MWVDSNKYRQQLSYDISQHYMTITLNLHSSANTNILHTYCALWNTTHKVAMYMCL